MCDTSIRKDSLDSSAVNLEVSIKHRLVVATGGEWNLLERYRGCSGDVWSMLREIQRQMPEVHGNENPGHGSEMSTSARRILEGSARDVLSVVVECIRQVDFEIFHSHRRRRLNEHSTWEGTELHHGGSFVKHLWANYGVRYKLNLAYDGLTDPQRRNLMKPSANPTIDWSVAIQSLYMLLLFHRNS